jgi:hypothetical protein
MKQRSKISTPRKFAVAILLCEIWLDTKKIVG